MIVTLIVLAYLAYKTYTGYKTGFTRYVIGLICSAIVFMVAIFAQNPLGNWLYTQFTGEMIRSNSTNNMELMIARFAAFFLVFLGYPGEVEAHELLQAESLHVVVVYYVDAEVEQVFAVGLAAGDERADVESQFL